MSKNNKTKDLVKKLLLGFFIRLLTPIFAVLFVFFVAWLGSVNKMLMLLVFFLLVLFLIFVGYITITNQRKILLRNWFLRGFFWWYALLTRFSKFWRLFYGWLMILLGVAGIIFIIQALLYG